jgi:adenylate cyclase class 2
MADDGVMAQVSGHEIEIKLRVAGPAAGRELLEAHGFRQTEPREHEDNLLVDTQDGALRRAGKLLRVRTARNRGLLTLKGPSVPSKHKQREEIETEVADPARFLRILENVGYQVVFRYEKYRSEYARSGEPGNVTLDETPIGTFLELEGPPGWIDQTAANLGFHESDYITASYGTLYLKYKEETGSTSRDMVFQSPNLY